MIASPTESFVHPQSHKIKPVFSNAVFATTVFVCSEVMFFMALISAFVVIKAGQGSWAVPEGVRLPVMATGFNTLVLFMSGLFLWSAERQLVRRASLRQVRQTLFRALLFGAFFVGFQGREWIQLIDYGFTMGSGMFAACFFLLIGAHAAHALAGVLAMVWLLARSRQSPTLESVRAMGWFTFEQSAPSSLLSGILQRYGVSLCGVWVWAG